jgi:putative AbiEii toxin of type IV toxin-antitoxin system
MKDIFSKVLKKINKKQLYEDIENLWKLELPQTSSAHAASAAYTLELLNKAGIENAEIINFPADGKTVYQDKRMPLAWDASVGRLTVKKSPVAFNDPVVADYQRHPFSLIKGSVSTPKGGQLVKIITEAQLFAGEECAGALILCAHETKPEAEILTAALDLGALGLITDFYAQQYRDAISWVNSCTEGMHWHVQCEDRPFIAFSVSPNTADELRHAVNTGELTALVESDGKRHEGVLPGVTALVPGRQKKEFWLIAHLYEPLSDDNSNGVAGAIEIVRVIKEMIAKKELPELEFSIRLVFSAEQYGHAAFADKFGGCLADKTIGAINLDSLMSGNPGQKLHINLAPSGSPFFGNYLMEMLVDECVDNENLAILSVSLTVGQNLEPKWEVVNNRKQENIMFKAADRAKLNCFMISDYVDRHFSWNKGNPLYSLLKINDGSFDDTDKNVVLDAIRNAKDIIDEHEHETLKNTTKDVINQASALGLDITRSKTSIDFRDIFFREGRVCLHDDKIPFRLKGKGSKRLISIAIQMSLAKHGGIILIDEIEQGLEPDRIKLLARTLKHNGVGQIFITTHSRDAITEINAGDIVVIHSDKKNEIMVGKLLDCDNDKLQATVRACPEAFFSKKIIVCEGATEVGICRALDKYRQNKSQQLMSFNDCAYVDGTGHSLVERADELDQAGLEVALLCDSDDSQVNDSKSALIENDIDIFDCEPDNSIEQQVFDNLPWEAVKKTH